VSARLGIVGGGQLALYLCEAAHALGVEVAIITEPGDAPALQLADTPIQAELTDIGAIETFLAACDVVTFDKEAIPELTLECFVAAEKRGRIFVRPGVNTLRLLKDKALQKAWMVRHELPTLPYCILPGNTSSLEDLTQKFGASIVQKARSGGYDGRGVQILAPLRSADQLWDVPSIVEPYLADCQEIAVITVRSTSGQRETYHPVGMAFDGGLNSVETVTMPASISSSLAEEAMALAGRAIDALDGVGVFAVEMFVNKENELLINEISPRVHNSGHITLDACNVSQFEQHVRAVLELPLEPILTLAPAAMLNIFDSEETRPFSPLKPVTTRLPELGSTVYWYGKVPGRTGRKMGHINAVGSGVEEALQLAQEASTQLHASVAGSMV
jgi:5-(carboxyamino)imidazole ribonucleotide synthase